MVLLSMIILPIIRHSHKLESIKYRADLAITGTLNATSFKKIDEVFVFVLQNTFNENAITYLQLSSIFSCRLDPEIRSFNSEGIFRHALLKFIRSAAKKPTELMIL